MIQFLKSNIFVLLCFTTGRVASGFLCPKPSQRRQLNRPTIAALRRGVSLRWHWPTSPATTFIVDPDPGFVSHRCRQITLALAAIEETPNLSDNKSYIDPMEEYGLSVSKWVPQTYEFDGEAFYVRTCYDEYYNQIMDLLKKYDSISVTGTEGIGKSLFYIYFFQRYRREFPQKSLVTASFSEQRVLIRCELFRHDSSEPRRCSDVPLRGLPDWPADIDCDLYLFDGPPNVQPADEKMIAFTSPNFEWLDSMSPDYYHRTVYMPVWTFQELLHAVDVLNFDISKEELERRFAFFGGSQRYCLTAYAEFLNQARDEVMRALSKVTGFQEVEACFKGNLDLNKVVHHLMHYVPETINAFKTRVPASDEISRLLEKRLSKNLAQERDTLMLRLQMEENLAGERTRFFMRRPQYLGIANDKGIFYDWLYKIFVHAELLKGGDFVVRSLLDSTLHHVQLDKNVGQYDRFKPSICIEDAIMKVYHIPESSSQPSIDSYVDTESCLLMFQITIQSNHSIKASGLVNLLNKVQMLERVKEHPKSAKIIFVVPQGMGAEFQKQKIANGEAQFFSDLDNADCTLVTGIGREQKKKLAEHNIFNCKQLMLAYDNGEACVDSVKNHIAEFKNLVKTIDQLEFLMKIPQYVMEVSYKTGS